MTNIIRPFVGELERRIGQSVPFIQAVVGPRQVGKTTGVLNLESSLGLPFFYCSADSPSPPGAEWLREQWIGARSNSGTRRGVLVLDEVQKIQGWSEQVKIMFDEERRRPQPLQVVILGSASWRLQAGLTESLAGRYELLRVPHWTYLECTQSFGWGLTEYLKFGGYPAPAALVSEVPRWQQFIRDSIIEPMLSRDLFALRTVGKPALFRQSLELALSFPAQEISLEKFLGQLQDRGNTTTIKGYLEMLEAGFVLLCLQKYSTRALSTKSSSPKLVPLCPALMQAFNPPSRIDDDPSWCGHVFEAAIGAALARFSDEIYYWRQGNQEVDYVLRTGGKLIAIEVKSGRVRQSNGLKIFKDNFPEASTVVITQAIGEKMLSSPNATEFVLGLL